MQDFELYDLRVGTVTSAKLNKRARKPSYGIDIDFGPEIGTKSTSSPIVDSYAVESLIGMQVIAVMNLGVMYIGDVKSEVKLLGVETAQGPILITPHETVENGSRIY